MSTALLAFIAVILCILFRILNVISQPQKPVLYCGDENFQETILKIAPLLQEPYVPTRLWGFSGHVQTIVQSVIGRLRCPWPIGERVYISLVDGSTLTYDLYQPLTMKYEDDVTLAIVPGIGNTSESVYVRTFVYYAQCHGYRCAVLNHIGALESVAVTAPRIFSYGRTDDFHAMLHHILDRNPLTSLVAVGFSLGGNIITKYMGEEGKVKPKNIIGAISICQGYCATEGHKALLEWQNFRRFYLYAVTEAVKSIILRHRKILLSKPVCQEYRLAERDIVAAATLPELDEAYTRRVHKFGSVADFYKWSSSINYLKNIKHPMIFLNSRDDPIVPANLLQSIRKHSSNHPKTMYIESAHGGHLGFYEGGRIHPNPVTWLDRNVIALVGSLVYAYHEGKMKATA